MLTNHYLQHRHLRSHIKVSALRVFCSLARITQIVWNEGMDQNVMKIDINLCTKSTYTFKNHHAYLKYTLMSHVIHSQYWAGDKKIKIKVQIRNITIERRVVKLIGQSVHKVQFPVLKSHMCVWTGHNLVLFRFITWSNCSELTLSLHNVWG